MSMPRESATSFRGRPALKVSRREYPATLGTRRHDMVESPLKGGHRAIGDRGVGRRCEPVPQSVEAGDAPRDHFEVAVKGPACVRACSLHVSGGLGGPQRRLAQTAHLLL
ncbi:hypothetical protein GCM10009525_08230 [Streptosporangium amethystogenes subsp. fukuiense]